MIKYVLFDFDGTVADSREVFLSSFNQLAAKHGFRKIEASNFEHVRRLSMLQRFSYLKVPFHRVPFLTSEFLSIYSSGVRAVSLFPGIADVFEALQELGVGIGIVSSNSVAIINGFLAHNGITSVNEVHCSGRLFGKDRLLRRFLKQKKLQAGEVLYVCDELRDIIACRKAGIRPVWVSWGFEIGEVVLPVHEGYIADTPGELIGIIKAAWEASLEEQG